MNSQKEPEYINIDSGRITDLTKHILNERFLLGGLIYQGNNSFVFKSSDITETKKKKLVVKIFKQNEEMTNEIKMLIRLKKI